MTLSPFLGAGAVVLDSEGALLLVSETGERKRGRWSLPAGKVERGETMVDAVGREVLEETGVRIEPTAVLGLYHSTSTSEQSYGLTVVFRTILISGQPSPSGEHPDVRFIGRTDVESMVNDGVFRSAELMRIVLADLDAGRSLPLSLIRTLGVT